jgi:hypothetical protein
MELCTKFRFEFCFEFLFGEMELETELIDWLRQSHKLHTVGAAKRLWIALEHAFGKAKYNLIHTSILLAWLDGVYPSCRACPGLYGVVLRLASPYSSIPKLPLQGSAKPCHATARQSHATNAGYITILKHGSIRNVAPEFRNSFEESLGSFLVRTNGLRAEDAYCVCLWRSRVVE